MTFIFDFTPMAVDLVLGIDLFSFLELDACCCGCIMRIILLGWWLQCLHDIFSGLGHQEKRRNKKSFERVDDSSLYYTYLYYPCFHSLRGG
jgi:hypothetical protein